jgi:hypothetical protein
MEKYKSGPRKKRCDQGVDDRKRRPQSRRSATGVHHGAPKLAPDPQREKNEATGQGVHEEFVEES